MKNYDFKFFCPSFDEKLMWRAWRRAYDILATLHPVILLLVVVLHWTLDSCCAWCSTKGYGFLVLAVPGLAGMETGLLLTYLQGRGNGSCSPLPGFKSSTGKHDMALKFRKIYTIWEKIFACSASFFLFTGFGTLSSKAPVAGLVYELSSVSLTLCPWIFIGRYMNLHCSSWSVITSYRHQLLRKK